MCFGDYLDIHYRGGRVFGNVSSYAVWAKFTGSVPTSSTDFLGISDQIWLRHPLNE